MMKRMASNKWKIAQLVMVRYLDKLVQPSYTLFALITAQGKLATFATLIFGEIDNANIEQLPLNK